MRIVGGAIDNATRRRGQRIVVERNALFMASRMMDAHRTRRRRATAIPPAPLRQRGRRHRGRQLHRSPVGCFMRCQKLCAVLRGATDRTCKRLTACRTAGRTAGRAFIAPVEHHRLHFGTGRNTVVCSGEARCTPVQTGVASRHQLTGADKTASTSLEGVVRNRRNLIAPGIALGTDRVDVAAAGLGGRERIERIAIAMADGVQRQRQRLALFGRQGQFDGRGAAQQQRRVETSVGPVVCIGERSQRILAVEPTDGQLGAMRQAESENPKSSVLAPTDTTSRLHCSRPSARVVQIPPPAFFACRSTTPASCTTP